MNAKEHSLILLAYIFVITTQASAGLNAIRKFAPLYMADAVKVLRCAVGAIAAVVSAMAFLWISAQLCFFNLLSESYVQTLLAICFVGCVAIAVRLFSEAGRLVRATNSTSFAI